MLSTGLNPSPEFKETLRNPPMPPRGSRNKSGAGSSTPMKPAFPDLREKHGTVEKLEEHLKQLDRATLQAMILNGAFPEACNNTQLYMAESNLRHCVYCHKTFDTEANGAKRCSVKHFRELDEDDFREFFPCCGKIMNNDDVWEGETRAEEEEPYCYEGTHWETEITTDDEKVFDPVDLGMVYEGGEKLPVTWWREWRTHGKRCEKMNCASKTKR